MSLPTLPSLPKDLQLRPSANALQLPTVCPVGELKAFARFGPYQAKIRKDPTPSFNWKVSDQPSVRERTARAVCVRERSGHRTSL